MSARNPDGPAVIVDPYSSGAFLGPAFLDAGVPVVAVLSAATPPDVYASSYRPNQFEQRIVATDDVDALVRAVRAVRPRCVLPGCESGVELADVLAPLVVPHVANDVATASCRRDKGDMAAAVADAGLPIIAQIASDDIAAVETWIQRSGLAGRDLVIKPPRSASTDGVTRVVGGAGWRDVFAQLLGERNRLGLVNETVVVQEYAAGIEYVVDLASYDGRHSVSDICRYHKVDNDSHMAVYDTMEWMSPELPEYEQLVGYARGVLDAVGMRYGTAHVELMLTADGPRLIEVGARPHGGGHPQFCRLATGDSQVDRAVRFFTGADVGDGYELVRNVSVVFLIARAAGTVRNIDVLDRVGELASHHVSVVNVRDGDWVEPTKDLFGSLDLGFVVFAHDSRVQVQADIRRLRSLEQLVQLDSSPPRQSARG